MTSPLASRVLDAALIGPTPDDGEAAGQGARARIQFKGTCADDRGADSSGVASDVDLATFGTELLAIPEDVRDPVLASHGIPLEAFEALKRNDRLGFVEARAAHLAQIERAFLSELRLPLPAQEAGEAEVDTDGD